MGLSSAAKCEGVVVGGGLVFGGLVFSTFPLLSLSNSYWCISHISIYPVIIQRLIHARYYE